MELTVFADELKKYHTFVLISHVCVDGDSMGSAAALAMMLEQMGKQCFWVTAGGISDELSLFPELMELTERRRIPDPEAAIAVDCADPERLDCNLPYFQNASVRFVIDHHKTNTGFGDWNYIRNYPATAQCVFELLKELNLSLTPKIARALYVAFLTDTGRFAHADVTAQSMHAVAELYDVIPDVPEVNRLLFERRTLEKTHLMGRALASVSLSGQGRIAYFVLDDEDFSETGATATDCEGIIRYAIEIEGVETAFSMRRLPDEEAYKVSFRSRSSRIDVSKVAMKWGGGGHAMAAGCTCKGKRDVIAANLIADLAAQIQAAESGGGDSQ